MERVVVFPAPLGPTSPMNLPAGRSRSIPATATCCPNRFQSPRTRTAAVPTSIPSVMRETLGVRPRAGASAVASAGVGEGGDQLLGVGQPAVGGGRAAGPLHGAAGAEAGGRRGHVRPLPERDQVQGRR